MCFCPFLLHIFHVLPFSSHAVNIMNMLTVAAVTSGVFNKSISIILFTILLKHVDIIILAVNRVGFC